MKLISRYIQDIYRAVELLKKRDPKCNIAFRGEAKDYGRTKLMPSIFRNPNYICKEKKLFQLLKDYGVTDVNASQSDLLIESQHYVAISRALDITFSIIPAFYFACCTYEEESGKIFVFGFPEYVSPHSDYIQEYYKVGNNGVYFHNFKVISHAQENDRIINQKGGFIFFQGTRFIPINSIYYKEIDIHAEDKKAIIKDLDLLFAVNEASIFPDRATIASEIVKPKFDAIEPIEDEISIENEIISAFSRLKYEAKMEKYEKIYNHTYFLRRLRKEKADLVSYIFFSDISKERRDSLINLVDSQYLILGGR